MLLSGLRFYASTPDTTTQSLPPKSREPSPEFAALSRKTEAIIATSLPSRSSLVVLINTVSSRSDLELLGPILLKYRGLRIPCLEIATDALIAKCIAIEAESFAFRLLSNRPLYSLFPSASGIFSLMEALAKDIKNIQDLNALYRAFTLFMYHDIAPSREAYNLLYKAGMESGLEEGTRRSEVVSLEMKTLGMA